jgi:hypothetical protein
VQRTDQEGLDALVDEPRDRPRRVVRVERGEDEVSGQAGLDRDLRRLEVTDLPHQDHVRVLAQDRPEPGREREPDLRLHLDLSDPFHLNLDRILESDDGLLRRVDLREGGVERRRLSRARRSGDEDDSVAAPDELPENGAVAAVEPDAIEAQQLLCPRKQPEHGPLPVLRGDRRHSDVVFPSCNLQDDAAVLGEALLGDVESAHDLDPRGDRLLHAFRERAEWLVEQVVRSEPDEKLALEGLDMNVAGALLDGLLKKRVDESDDRRALFVRIEQVLRLLDDLRREVVEIVALERLRDLSGRVSAVKHRVDAVEDHSPRGQDRLDLEVRVEKPEVVQGIDEKGVSHRDQEPPVLAPDGQERVGLRERDGDLGRELRIYLVWTQGLTDGKPVELTERAEEPIFGQEPELDDDVGQALARFLVASLHLLEGLLRQGGGSAERLEELEGGRRHGSTTTRVSIPVEDVTSRATWWALASVR